MDIRDIIGGFATVAFMGVLCGCASEAPFEGADTGTVQLHTVVNNLTTRAITSKGDVTGYDKSKLEENCVVYISRANGNTTGDNKTKDGLVYKAKGLSNVESAITLPTGKYVAEAWTGDSVPASWGEQKYFKAREPFEIAANSVVKVTLDCKIQNTVVIVDTRTTTGAAGEAESERHSLDELMRDYTITVKSTTGESVFTKGNITERAYFMMDYGDTKLSYTIEGYRAGTTGTDGHFSISGEINDVKRSWQYTIKIMYNPPKSNDGYVETSNISINIADEEVEAVTSDNNIGESGTTIEGIDFDMANALAKYTTDADIPQQMAVQICGAGNFAAATFTANGTEYNLLSETSTLPQGISWSSEYNESVNVSTGFLIFEKSYITNLQGNNAFTISATDGYGKTETKTLNINR